MLTRGDLAAYAVVDREPVSVGYRGREVLTNPPPSAGRDPDRPGAGAARTPSRAADGRADRRGDGAHPARADARVPRPGSTTPSSCSGFLAGTAGRLGSTTHIAVLDRDGWACSVTCSNGSASGVVVPGTGVHLNNMLGEQDLNPLGFHRHPPGRRMPSMMAPTVVLRDGAPELARRQRRLQPDPLGDPADDRARRSTTGCAAQDAVQAPRACTSRTASSTPSRGSTPPRSRRAGRRSAAFRERNLFFGGVQAAARDARRRVLRRRRSAPGRRGDRGGAAVIRARVTAWLRSRVTLSCCWHGRRAPAAALDVQSPDLFLLTRTGQGGTADAAGQRRRHDPLQRRQGQA